VTPFTRFLAFEAIGWALGAAVLVWLEREAFISTGLAWLLFGALVVKDLVLYPLTRKAYEHGPAHGAAELLGADVRAETVLSPEGWVRAGSERWRARLVGDGGESLPAGALARVRELRGLTLIVEPIAPSEIGL